MAVQIARAEPPDRHDIFRLIEENNLPVAGLEQHLATAIVARESDRIVGCAALEVYADGALLRSVAVAPELHRRGAGSQLTAAAIELAKSAGVPAVYLLTTTAEHYFPRFGFERITRGDVPPGVRASVEFTSACPATAVVMRKLL